MTVEGSVDEGEGVDLARLLVRLDPDQRAAVTAPPGPVVVIAGAGSGKTRVLTNRIAYRIATKSAEPSHTVAFTFTRQAAAELQRRLAREGVERSVVAGTFHSVAYRILRRRWEDRGRHEPPTLSTNRIEVLTEQLRGDRRLAAVTATEIEWARARLIGPTDYPRAATSAGRRPGADVEQVAKLFADFEAYKRKRRILDFDDLLSECTAEIRRPGVADAISWWHRHLHVDEFQDINPLQYEFLEALRNGGDDLFIVGDPAQAIYGWNGSDSGLLDAVRNGPLRPITIELTTNYRSTPEVVDAGDRVLASNRVGGVHRADRPSGRQIITVSCRDEAEESRRLVVLANELRPPGARWSSVAVLGRTHEILRQAAVAFAAAGIPTRTVTRRGIAGAAGNDPLRPARSAGDSQDLHAWAIDLAWPGSGPEGSDGSGDDGPGRGETDPDDGLSLAGDPLDPVRRAIDTVRAFEEAGGGDGRAFAAWMDLNNVESAVEGDAVELVTMHAAKGREWSTVIVAGIDSVGMPAPIASRSAARAEEARLLYVALTRAADRLAITWAEKRGGKKAGRSPLLPDLALREPDASDVPVLLPERPRPAAAAAPTADPGAAVMARLRNWRAAAARAAGVPAAFLLDDRSLDRIVATMPATQDDLAAIDGIGPLLARRFAGRILPLLSEPGGSRPAAQ